MQYTNFERDFMRRTLVLVRDYRGPHDATLLLNCLLGLLIVPHEKSLEKIPEDAVESLSRWGISPNCIKSFGKARSPDRTREKVDAPPTLRSLVKGLRNSVAHFRFKPVYKRDVVYGFRFTDLNKFEAEIPLAELQVFVERLSAYLEDKFNSELDGQGSE